MLLVLSIFLACVLHLIWFIYFFFKQKTAYAMRISDWSSDVCSSDLPASLEGDHRQPVCSDGLDLRCAGVAGLGELARRGLQLSLGERGEIGSASWRDSVCQYWYVLVVAASLNQKHTSNTPLLSDT